MEQPVIDRPSGDLPGCQGLHPPGQGFQVKCFRCPFDLHHPDLLSVPDGIMTQQVFLPPVEAVHPDRLDPADPVCFPCQPAQEAEQRALAGSGRSGQHHQDPPAGFLLHRGQFSQERQENPVHRAFAVLCSNLDAIDLHCMGNHLPCCPFSISIPGTSR